MKNKNGGNVENKMTIEEYQQKYSRRENSKNASFAVRMLATVVGVFLFACLFFVALKFYEIHLYAGIAASVVCVILYIFLYIVPIVKIFKMDYFITDVNPGSAAKAKRHNKRVRRSIAKNIIDLNASVDCSGWYDDKIVIELAACLNNGDDEGLKEALTRLYNGPVKAAARSIILKSSIKCGFMTAASQSSLVDTAIVAMINLQMVKDIFYLYGFRPSDARLRKIFTDVINECIFAYGVGSITKMVGNAVSGVPIIGAVVDSALQGVTNGIFVSAIGFKARSYLGKEYKLQNILDGIDLSETEEEKARMQEEIRKGIKDEFNRKGKQAA